MMEEAALGYAGGRTHVLDPSRGISFGAHQVDGRGEQSNAGGLLGHESPYRPVRRRSSAIIPMSVPFRVMTDGDAKAQTASGPLRVCARYLLPMDAQVLAAC